MLNSRGIDPSLSERTGLSKEDNHIKIKIKPKHILSQ